MTIAGKVATGAGLLLLLFSAALLYQLARVRELAAARHAAPQAVEIRAEAESLALAGVLAVVILGLVVTVVTVHSIRAPLRRLIAGTRAVAAGQYSFALDVSKGDEFAQVAESFNAMVRRLDELDRMKKDLLSHVSHELKTPLATIQETHRLILEEVPGPLNDQQRYLLELNLESSERLSRLITNLLDLSRLEAGIVAYDFKLRDLGELIRRSAESFTARSRERRVRLVVELPPRPLKVRCAGDRTVQVLDNLLDNALRFSPPESTVVITARAAAAPPLDLPEPWRHRLGAPNGALISVTDAGPGVPAAERERIFERFHQAGPRRGGGAVGGTGLGLAICREIVEAHRGAIWVTQNLDVGSTFWVFLPALMGP